MPIRFVLAGKERMPPNVASSTVWQYPDRYLVMHINFELRTLVSQCHPVLGIGRLAA